MTLLFNTVKDINCDTDGETKDVQTIAYKIEDTLSEEGHFHLLKWLIAQLLKSEYLGDETIILMEDVLKEH